MKYLLCALLLLTVACQSDNLTGPSHSLTATTMQDTGSGLFSTGVAPTSPKTEATCETILAKFPRTESRNGHVTVHYRIENNAPSTPAALEIRWDTGYVLEDRVQPERFPLGVGSVVEGTIEHHYPTTDEPTTVSIRLDARLDGVAGGCGRGRTVTVSNTPLESGDQDLPWDSPCYGGITVRGFQCYDSGAGVSCAAALKYIRSDLCPNSPEVICAVYYTPEPGVVPKRIVKQWVESPFSPGEERAAYTPGQGIVVEGRPGRWMFKLTTKYQAIWWGGGITL